MDFLHFFYRLKVNSFLVEYSICIESPFEDRFLGYDLRVQLPVGDSVKVNCVKRSCFMEIKDRECLADLVVMEFKEIYVILSMDWLS